MSSSIEIDNFDGNEIAEPTRVLPMNNDSEGITSLLVPVMNFTGTNGLVIKISPSPSKLSKSLKFTREGDFDKNSIFFGACE